MAELNTWHGEITQFLGDFFKSLQMKCKAFRISKFYVEFSSYITLGKSHGFSQSQLSHL